MAEGRDYLDFWLDAWAVWRRGQHQRLGYSSQSPVHRMMTTLAPTRTERSRRKPALLVMEGEQRRVVRRHTEPMYAKETAAFRTETIEDNPMCELMDRAVAAMEPRAKDALMLKFCVRFDDKTAAATMRTSLASYRVLLLAGRNFLDGWLKGGHRGIVDDVVRKMAG